MVDSAAAPPTLTVREAAAELGLSQGRVTGLIHAGAIAATRTGQRYAIPRAALDAYRAARVDGRRARRITDTQLAWAIRALREGKDDEAAAAEAGMTGRGLRQRLLAIGLHPGDLRPAPPPNGLDETELRRRRGLLLKQRQWEQGHAAERERYTWNTQAAKRRVDLHVMLTESAAEDLRAEAERRQCSMSALIAAALYDAGITYEP